MLTSALLSRPAVHAAVPESAPDADFEAGQILVKFKPLVPPFVADSVIKSHGFSTVKEAREISVRNVHVPPGQEPKAIADLRKNPLVEYAELNSLRKSLFIPNDSMYSSYQWNLGRINMEQAWDITRGAITVTVAVIDTGLDMTNPDRPVNVVSPRNECSGDSTMSDDVGHGTHVSGIIAANTDNGTGVSGVAPGLSIMPVRVECQGVISVFTETNAVLYAANSGAKAINISLGGIQANQAEQDAINYALGKGLVVVAAAGNEYELSNPLSYPAAYPGVLAVGASTYADGRAYYSEVQPYVAVVAPGGDPASGTDPDPNHWILSTYISPTNYVQMAGTSMSAPQVAALAGLIWTVKPGLSGAQVTNIITSTALDISPTGKDNATGWGRIDAYAALRKALGIVGAPTVDPVALEPRAYMPSVSWRSPSP